MSRQRRSIYSGQGYYLNDNTCSGGLRIEDDLINCKHCQRSMLRCDWVQEGGFCHRCDAPICTTCADPRLTGDCKPIQQRIDDVLNDMYRRAQNARVLGI